MSLNEIKCKNAKSASKIQKLSDEKGMYLQVNPSGSKYWRLKYRIEGREKLLALGVYPEVKPDVIERQLAHRESNAVRAAYNHAQYLKERREMMQWWADFLDERKV